MGGPPFGRGGRTAVAGKAGKDSEAESGAHVALGAMVKGYPRLRGGTTRFTGFLYSRGRLGETGMLGGNS